MSSGPISARVTMCSRLVFVQCDAMYRADGDPDFAPVGETEFVNGIAAMSASGDYGPTRVCAGIVGFAEFLLGARVDAVLEAHLRAAGSRFRGIRGRSVWDADSTIILETAVEALQGRVGGAFSAA
jgi:L-fuconolactonase